MGRGITSLNYFLLDEVVDDIVYVGKDRKELRETLYDYISSQSHIDENQIRESDLQMLKYSSLKKIGLSLRVIKNKD